MATAKNPDDTLAASLRYQHKWINEMRASARMRARLMKKIPKPVEFPRSLDEMTSPSVGATRAAAMRPRLDASTLEQPSFAPGR